MFDFTSLCLTWFVSSIESIEMGVRLWIRIRMLLHTDMTVLSKLLSFSSSLLVPVELLDVIGIRLISCRSTGATAAALLQLTFYFVIAYIRETCYSNTRTRYHSTDFSA